MQGFCVCFIFHINSESILDHIEIEVNIKIQVPNTKTSAATTEKIIAIKKNWKERKYDVKTKKNIPIYIWTDNNS